MRAVLFCIALLASVSVWAQTPPEVIINEYFNETSQENEWTEILVVKDNTDLTGWYIGDNNGTTDVWRPKFQFTTNALWRHLRRGTYIIIQHAAARADCGPEDLDKADGHIKVCARNTTYLNGGDATSLFLNSSGDFLHIVTPDGRHVFGLGHDSDPGGSVRSNRSCVNTSSNWTSTSQTASDTRPCGPFAFYENDVDNGVSFGNKDGLLASFSITPGYFVTTATDTRFGTMPSSEGHGNTAQNIAMIQNLRRPDWTSQTNCVAVVPGGYRLTWTPMPDPYPADGTLGYLVLRGSIANMPMPPQGQLYPVGTRFTTSAGFTDVIGIYPSTQTSFVDSPGSATTSYYRVVAYRYTQTPGLLSNDRGTAYNLEQFADFTLGGSPEYQVQGTSLACVGDTVRFTATGLPPIVVPQWSFDTVTGAKVTVLQDAETVIAVIRDEPATRDSVKASLTFTDASACNPNVTLRAYAQVRNKPLVAITPVDTLANPNTDVQFHVEVTGTTDLLSVPALDITPPSDDVSIRFLGGDTSLIVTGLIRNLPRCSASDTATIREKVLPQPVEVKYNNIVTGNRNSENYTFRVQGATFRDLVIHNRWGKPVYKAGRYDNSWRGEPGTYFFTATTIAPCTTLDCDPVVTAYKGWIEVVK